jgi:hypothetical protein
MLFERGLVIEHTTIHRWVIRYPPEIGKRVRTRLKSSNDSSRLDATYLKSAASRTHGPETGGRFHLRDNGRRVELTIKERVWPILIQRDSSDILASELSNEGFLAGEISYEIIRTV